MAGAPVSRAALTPCFGSSLLYIDDSVAVKNDGRHSSSEYCAVRTLTAGRRMPRRRFEARRPLLKREFGQARTPSSAPAS